MRVKRLLPKLPITWGGDEPVHSSRSDSERRRSAYLRRQQPAVVTLAFAANHLASLGQARDEMERKA